MSSDATQPPKPMLNSTDSSRLRAGLGGTPVPPPSATVAVPPPQETSTGRLRRMKAGEIRTDTSRFAKPVSPAAETTTAQPPPAAATQVDPVTQRDTSTGRLRRMKASEPASSSAAEAAATVALPPPGSKPQTDTVKLKVQREAKKEGTPSASQTVRLRPPSAGLDGQATARPAPGAAGTIKLSPPPSAAIPSKAAQTIRLRPAGTPAPAPASTGDASAARTVKVNAPEETEEADGGKRTLKLRKDAPSLSQAPVAAAGEAAMAARAVAASAVGRPDMVFNTFSILSILTVGGFLGILGWQMVLHIF